jgi:molecular chaperone HscB
MNANGIIPAPKLLKKRGKIMSNVIGMKEFTGTAIGGLHCWLCQKQVSTRALFCHHCGTIQPARDIDHFARLGLERRIDIEMEPLEHQYAALCRTLDPQRFIIRGMGERGHAAKQLEALSEAYDTLRDPLRRSRYWLGLHEKEFEEAAASNPMVVELQQDLESAADPAQCDRVAQKAGQAMETGIMGLMQALRGENWKQANTTLIELDGLETILGAVRARRAELTVGRK